MSQASEGGSSQHVNSDEQTRKRWQAHREQVLKDAGLWEEYGDEDGEDDE